MKCEKCGAQLPKNSSKNGIDYFYCRKCKKSYSSKKHELKHHVFEEYIARLIFLKCIKQKNEFTKTTWTLNQIARLLGHHHREIRKWVNNKSLPKISKKEFIKYLDIRDNGADILNILGYGEEGAEISNNLRKIIERSNSKKGNEITLLHFDEADYLKLVNIPIKSRMDAIVVLSALLGCKSSEIFGANYNELYSDNAAMQFSYNIHILNNTTEISKLHKYASGKTYPLTKKMFDIIKWLKADTESNMKQLGADYNILHKDFLCVQQNGDFIKPYLLRNHIQDICDIYSLPFTFYRATSDGEELKMLKLMVWFHCMRNSVKQMMLNAGVDYGVVRNIFGYNPLFEKMQSAYNILNEYIKENSSGLMLFND